jgi:protein MpaA
MINFIFKIIVLICLLSSIVISEEKETLVNSQCTRIGNKLGSVSIKDCLDIGLHVTDGESVKGAAILIKEYPPLEKKEPLGKVLLIGGIHGDEYSSVSIIFKWLATLNKHHSGLFHWLVIPLLNPDGLLRKESQRINENNVDLNRNFPINDWKNTAIKYWIEETGKNPRYYPGPEALSEPESNWLLGHINVFRPDVIVSVHAPHGIIDHDGPRIAPSKLGTLYLDYLGTYPGSLGNYAGVQYQIPVITIELPYAGIMPTKDEINSIWRDLVKWLRKNIIEEENSMENAQDAAPS